MRKINKKKSAKFKRKNTQVSLIRLINDIMNVVLPPDGVPDVKWNKIPTQDCLGNRFINTRSNVILN